MTAGAADGRCILNEVKRLRRAYDVAKNEPLRNTTQTSETPPAHQRTSGGMIPAKEGGTTDSRKHAAAVDLALDFWVLRSNPAAAVRRT